MSTATGSYFENHFTDTMVNNTTVMSEEESNSSSSISPNDKVSLAYPQPYFISTAATYLMSDYDCRPTHPYAALTNQGMMYPSSSPEEQQAYVPSDEALSTTTSPSSTMVSASLHQFSPGLPFTASSKECNSEEMGFYSCPDGSGYDYSQSMFDYRPSLSPNGTLSPVEVPMVSYSDRHCDNKRHSTDSVCYSKHADSSSHHHHHHHHNEAQEKKSGYVKRHSQSKAKKRCSNCHTPQSPSWRRSISKSTKGDLLCNACGLYEKTAKRKRMLVTQDDGATKVVRKRDVRGYTCSRCGTTDATRWRKTHDSVQCEKCTRGRR